jgi:hypothetical protein
MKLIKNIFLFIAVLLAHTAFSQGDLPGSEVDVVKNFNARLISTEKVNVTPKLPRLDTTSQRQQYNVVTKTIQVEYLPPKIKPLADKRQPLQKKYNGFLKAGVGLPLSLYGEGSYDIVNKKDKHRFGVDLYHYSANNNKNIENQIFSDTRGELNGTYFFDQGFAVGGMLGYETEKVHFFGYNDLNKEIGSEFTFDPTDVEQRIWTLYGNADVFNGERLALDFNYNAGVDFYILQDLYGAKERGFVLDLSATKWINEVHPLSVKLVTDFTSFNNDEKSTLNNFSLMPNFTWHQDRFKVKLGANITSHEDNFSFFPDIEANATIIEGIVTAFVGANGELHKNSFRNLSNYNPYIESNVDMRNTKYLQYYGGVKGNVQGIDYHAKIGYKNVENLTMFQLSEAQDSISRFDVLYDTATIFSIKANISAPIFKGLSLTGTVSQNIYTLENEEKAWHLPSFTVGAGARYRTEDQKLLVKADFFLENGVPYKDINGEAQNLNGLFDISVGAEYFFTEKIGGFIQLNNLASNNRQRWHRYPTLGLNALIGITARF